MSEPIREQALTRIITALQSMKGPRPGLDGLPWGSYPNDPVVTRGYTGEELVNQYPALFVSRRGGSSIGGSDETTVGDFQGVFHYFRVDIYGYVHTEQNVLAGTWLERLWDDVHTTLMANSTLGGIAQKISLEDEDEYDEDTVQAGFRQGVTVVLYESKFRA